MRSESARNLSSSSDTSSTACPRRVPHHRRGLTLWRRLESAGAGGKDASGSPRRLPRAIPLLRSARQGRGAGLRRHPRGHRTPQSLRGPEISRRWNSCRTESSAPRRSRVKARFSASGNSRRGPPLSILRDGTDPEVHNAPRQPGDVLPRTRISPTLGRGGRRERRSAPFGSFPSTPAKADDLAPTHGDDTSRTAPTRGRRGRSVPHLEHG